MVADEAYPSGAPGCGLTPGHGQEQLPVNVTVQHLGDSIWQVSLQDTFRGIIINAESEGEMYTYTLYTIRETIKVGKK